jgi:hypothetical protein
MNKRKQRRLHIAETFPQFHFEPPTDAPSDNEEENMMEEGYDEQVDEGERLTNTDPYLIPPSAFRLYGDYDDYDEEGDAEEDAEDDCHMAEEGPSSFAMGDLQGGYNYLASATARSHPTFRSS